MISTKCFMCINWGHYVIYLQNKKFVWLIVWPGGAYTDDTYATKAESWSHIRIHFVNHDCIGSLWQSQMSQKPVAGPGAHPAHAPLRVRILSFRHTHFMKRRCIGSWHSRHEIGAPLYEKSWIRHWNPIFCDL